MLCDLEVILLSLCFRNVLLQLVEDGGKCGMDYSPADMVYDGLATVETYPWLGWLFYPVDNYKLTTTVVLITRELVITSAFDVDRYPKLDFRDKSRVVLGSNCSGLQIKIRDYTYHPEYKEPTNSALAIIHLDITQLDVELHPICTPPAEILSVQFFAMTLSRDCDRSSMHIYKMIYVEPEECETFYRKSGLDLDSMWPTHTACAKALSGGKCVWRNGAVLVLREKHTWKLVGLGVYGPGCETPSRYLDYGMYHEWVRSTILRIGKPAVTRIGPDHLILRRTGSLQRFGRCDFGETKIEIYTERTTLSTTNLLHTKYAKINLTLFANVDYSCVVVRVSELGHTIGQPKISLKRWCTSPMQICYELQYMQVDFYVEVEFQTSVEYEVLAYGIEVKLIERKAFMAYMNNVSPRPYNLTCGLDNSNASMLYEGLAGIETYPWMGTFFYENEEIMTTTSVVLITKQMVLASAYDIDRLPREDIRKRSRVVLGRDCEGPSIRIRDYTFHPDYIRNTYSALAMIQLETDQNEEDLMPICPPPTFFIEPQFYAMTTSKDCTKGNIYIREMVYVNKDQCRQFYRKSGLDAGMFWPSHTACARAVSGGKCTWRSGTALAVKQDGHWRLMGFGVHGPGCGAPARFLDYGMQEPWVRRSIARIGMPAITRLADNHLVLRRSLSNVQRFGPCDPEETKLEMYTDLVYIKSSRHKEGRTYYNVTLIHSVEYSCVVFRAEPLGVDSYESGEKIAPIPKLYLRRWCAGPPQVCYGFHLLEVQFSVEIKFSYKTTFSIAAYGKEAKIIDPALATSYGNKIRKRPHLPTYKEVKDEIKSHHDIGYRWFYQHHLTYDNQPRNDKFFLLINEPESKHW